MSIMGASSKKTSKPSSSKKSLLIIGGIFIAVLLLSFWYYQSQRPNYRDLENVLKDMDVPSNWSEVSRNDKKGVWGLFCVGSGIDISCPILDVVYQYPDQGRSAETDIGVVERLIRNAGLTKTDVSLRDCTESSASYYCAIDAESGGVRASFTVSATSDRKQINVRLQ